jgi:hypothetical protein
MKAQSSVYVKLQGLYKSKARQDAAEVLKTAQSLEGGPDIDPEEVDLFCKNAAFVKLINANGGTPTAERLAAVFSELSAVLGFTRSTFAMQIECGHSRYINLLPQPRN